METYEQKISMLKEQIGRYATEDIVVAFSGGVDSSLLLKLACDSASKNNKTVYAVTVHTTLHPKGDIDISKKVAQEAGAVHIILMVDELREAGIMDNPVDRCYRCKKCIFLKLKAFAKDKNITTILEGTNEDDLHVYRPGIQALRELDIISPLADAKMTKEEVRRLAGENFVSVANRPSAPCLATRFPYGTNLSYEIMKRVEAGEAFIRELGFHNIRLRIHDNVVRIEVDEEVLVQLLTCRQDIVNKLKKLGFDYVTLDLEGFRSGSMDLHLAVG